jgi:hypothetical protein
MHRVPLLTLLLLATSVACAPQYATIAMGQYADFQPYARVYTNTIDIELARPAYVAVIRITTPGPGYNERPVLFQPIYPRYETDETHFGAGRHRVTPRRTSLIDPRNCREAEKPSLDGCRRALYMLPGVGSPGEIGTAYVSDPSHYFVVASEEFVDPYALAEDLFEMAFDRLELSAALKTGRATIAGTELERALLDRPGSPIWGAFYVSGK